MQACEAPARPTSAVWHHQQAARRSRHAPASLRALGTAAPGGHVSVAKHCSGRGRRRTPHSAPLSAAVSAARSSRTHVHAILFSSSALHATTDCASAISQHAGYHHGRYRSQLGQQMLHTTQPSFLHARRRSKAIRAAPGLPLPQCTPALRVQHHHHQRLNSVGCPTTSTAGPSIHTHHSAPPHCATTAGAASFPAAASRLRRRQTGLWCGQCAAWHSAPQ